MERRSINTLIVVVVVVVVVAAAAVVAAVVVVVVIIEVVQMCKRYVRPTISNAHQTLSVSIVDFVGQFSRKFSASGSPVDLNEDKRH